MILIKNQKQILMAIYSIRQAPDDYSESTGLSKHGRSRMPGCNDLFQAYFNKHTKEYHTGLSNEEAEVYGKRLHQDLGKDSEFWSGYSVGITADSPRKFNTDLVEDIVAYKMLLANAYVAPNKDALSKPEYRNTQYYAFTEEGEIKETVRESKIRDKALGKLVNVMDNKDALLLYGQYLEGLKYNSKMSADTLYNNLRGYILDKDLQKAKNFLAVLDKSAEEMQLKIIVDRALKQRLITTSRSGKGKDSILIYQFGQVTLGNSLEDVYINIAKPEYAPELLSIKQELDSKK